MLIEIVFDDGREQRYKPPAKYPNAKKVLALFGKYPYPWNVNKQVLSAAEFLFEEKGMEELTELFTWYAKHHKDKFCPKFSDPMELVMKYPKLEEHLARTK